MWHSMFAVQIPILEKILRTVLVYATILILFRLVGKRDLATLNLFDFVVLFLLSNVVQNAIIGNDTSLLGGIIGAVTLPAPPRMGRAGELVIGWHDSTGRAA